MKTCVDCGRRDLVAKVTEMMKESNVSFNDLMAELHRKDPTGTLGEKVKTWMQESEAEGLSLKEKILVAGEQKGEQEQVAAAKA